MLIVLMLAACNGRSGQSVRVGEPGLDVADAALNSGSPQIALQAVDQILARKPNDAAALVVRGDALTAMGRFDEAAEDYSRVLQSNSDQVSASIGLGRIRLASDPASAEALFMAVLRHDPRNTIAMTDLGIARDLQGRHIDAQAAYREALGINPELRAAQVNLALSMAMSEQGSEAIKIIRPLAMAPSASKKIRQNYAAVLALSGDRPSAEHILSADLSPAETRQVLDAYAARAGSLAPSTENLAAADPAGRQPAAAPMRVAEAASPVRSAPPNAPPAVAPVIAPAAQQAAVMPPASEAPASPAAPPTVSVPGPGAQVATSAAVQVPGVAEAPVTTPLAAATGDAAPVEAVRLAAGSVAVQMPPPAEAPMNAGNPTPVATPLAASMPVSELAQAADPAAPHVVVQLTASMTENDANGVWTKLQEKLPVAMKGRTPSVTRVERDGHVFWRLRTGGFASTSDARAFCDQVRGVGGACVLSGAS